MAPIKLDSPCQIPNALLCELRPLASVFMHCEFSEQLLQDGAVHTIATALDQLCIQHGVIGYHYTRAVREEIESGGLKLSNGVSRRDEFMHRYGHLFSTGQRQRIKRKWAAYFDPSATSARDGRLWFNFTLGGLNNGGADRLLTYFGGEAVYMPLTQDQDIAVVIRSIGQPLVVKCGVASQTLRTFSQLPWGRIWLSAFHLSLNKDAHQFDVDAYSIKPVERDRILSIRSPRQRGDGSWE